MKGIEIDADNRIGRYEAGVLWMEANPAAGEHGLANLSGSAPDIGIVGYTTGGGFGWLARRYGLACNSVRAIELVTADGEQRRVDADNDPGPVLGRARRAAGASASSPRSSTTLSSCPRCSPAALIYAADERAPRRSSTATSSGRRTVPDEVTSIVRFLHLPPLPVIPEPLQDKPLITIGACYAGPGGRGRAAGAADARAGRAR